MNRKILYTIGMIVGSVVGTYLLWRIPEWYFADWAAAVTANELLKLQNELRGTIVQAFGGAALLIGLFFTWRNIRATEVNLQIAQKTTASTLELTKESQITERFSRAIEQLGSEKLEVRLGGIYALERVAKDSASDHWTVMEVLTAFIRENAKWAGAKQGKESAPERNFLTFPTDIQSILTVLGRRGRGKEREDGDRQFLFLINTDLRHADFFEAHFERAYLNGAHLEDSIAIAAHFDRAQLGGAHLERANFDYTSCQGAAFEGAYLKDASLNGTNFQGATLKGTHLEGVDLSSAIGLTWLQVILAHRDDKTKLPPGVGK